MSEYDPIVGNWYKNLETRTQFEVVAIDEQSQTVEIQYFEGEVEELDMEAWRELELDSIEPPEDWSGAFDDLEKDDLGYDDTPTPSHRENPLDRFD